MCSLALVPLLCSSMLLSGSLLKCTPLPHHAARSVPSPVLMPAHCAFLGTLI